MEEENKVEVTDEKGNVVTFDKSVYPSNSNKSKEMKKSRSDPVVKVAHGKPVVKKKKLMERIKDWIFVNEEDYEDIIYEDIIRPAILDAIGDISHNVVNMVRDTIDGVLGGMLGGDGRRRRSSYYRSSYDDDYWRDRRRERRRDREEREGRRRLTRRSDDIAAKVESRAEANDLIHAMQERLHDYHMVTVLNFYDMADMPTRSTDDDFGWDMGHPFEATITRVRDGYIVEPNSPIALDR